MARLAKIILQGQEHRHADCPVSVEVPIASDKFGSGGKLALRDVKTGAEHLCQFEPSRGGTRLTFVVRELAAGLRRQFALVRLPRPGTDLVCLVDDRDASRLDIVVHGKRFTSYHYGEQWVRPFLHPLIGPGEVGITRSWPISGIVKGETRDHPHHKSLWVAHGECGTVDNWSEEPGHGYQRQRRFASRVSGPVYGEFVAKIDWCDSRERKQFEETRRIRVYAVSRRMRLLDVEIRFRMNQGPVTFRDTKEGGLLSIRVASAMDVPRGGRIENGYGGRDERECWGKKAPWCDYSGVVDGRAVGIAVMDHESNPRYPTEWHVRNYGLMTANCFGWSHFRPEARERGDLRFRKSSTTTWRYRVYIHEGDATKGKVRERFLDFIAPPEVTVG